MNNTAPTSPSGHSQQPTRDEQGRRARLWGVLKAVTVIAALLGLGTLNVLTLVNEEAHNKAYNLFKRVAGELVSTENSPTATRERMLRATTEKLAGENAELRSRLSKLASATRLLISKTEALILADNVLAEETKMLAKRTRSLAEENKTLSERVKNTKSVLRRLSGTVIPRLVMTATRNVTGTFSEAIPYVGIAAIATLAAWDVKDACDNMRDLDQLKKEAGLDGDDQSKVCGVKVPTADEIADRVRRSWEDAYKAVQTELENFGVTLQDVSPQFSGKSPGDLWRSAFGEARKR